MKLLRIIPFAKGIHKEHLTYFSSKTVKPGSLVEISIRKRKVHGLVIDSEDAKDLKSSVKQSNFQLKKINNVIKTTLFDPKFITSLEESSDYFATYRSVLLHHFTSTKLIQNIENLELTQKPKINRSYEIFALQESDDIRTQSHLQIISEKAKADRSTLIMCPTIVQTKKIEKNLHNSSQKIYTLHSKLTSKKLIETWNSILTSKDPVVIITTPLFLGIPRHDIGSLIIEQEGSRYYIGQKKPYPDFRKIAEEYVHTRKLTTYFSDDLLSIDRYKQQKEKEIKIHNNLSTTDKSNTPFEIIHMKRKDQSFRIFSSEVIQKIKDVHSQNKHSLLLVGRKGLAPHITCRDCSQAVSCMQCEKPVVLIRKQEEETYNSFYCRQCRKSRSAHEACTHCRSWRLQELGIGTQRVEEEFMELQADHQKLSTCKYFVIDSSVTKSESQTKKTIKEFYATEGAVLITTEMSLTHLHKQIDYTAIISIDSMFTLPNITIHEHITRLLLQLKKIAKEVHIQTRLIDISLFEQVQKGDLSDFQKRELALRKMLEYPPYVTFIKISIQGDTEKVRNEIHTIQNFLLPQESQLYSRDNIHTLVFSVDSKTWPTKDLVAKIKKLPLYVKIEINPNQI